MSKNARTIKCLIAYYIAISQHVHKIATQIKDVDIYNLDYFITIFAWHCEINRF